MKNKLNNNNFFSFTNKFIIMLQIGYTFYVKMAKNHNFRETRMFYKSYHQSQKLQDDSTVP